MKHIIVGTAGHIDHGKTTLIRAITGRNTDRLKEEQKRGISIELGFTYFDLPSGQRAGIIDVPGHEKFIKNMLAGVMGIDIVILVVAADESLMPQTREHLAILNMLGIEAGFIVITKKDLVDEEWIDMVEEEIREEIKGTFLENTKIIRASSTSREGIDDIINLIDEYAENLKDKDDNDTPRLPVDRVFSISGFGTIVTGTLISGKFNKGDEVQIFPGESTSRIRSLEVHDNDSEVAYGGQRVAMNLAGIKKDEIERGDVIAPIGSMKKTKLIDVKVNLLKSIDKTIDNRTRIRLYIGAKEVLCRMVLLDKEVLEPGDQAYAQLRLEEEIVAKRGDKFIIRFYSPMFTIGGGEVLEPNPLKKKRFDESGIKELEIKELGSSKDIIENIIEEKSKDFPTLKEIARQTAMLEENIKDEINELGKEDKIITFTLTKDIYIIHQNYFNNTREKIVSQLKGFHEKHPLRTGMPKEEIKSRFFSKIKPKIVESFIELLIDKKHIKQNLEYISLYEFEVKLNEEQENIYKDIQKVFQKDMFQPPKVDELFNMVGGKREDLEEVFIIIVAEGKIIKLNEDIYLSKDAYNNSIEKLKEFINTNGAISIGEFRDVLNTNRKVALGLLEYFDQEKITKRDNDKRVLSK